MIWDEEGLDWKRRREGSARGRERDGLHDQVMAGRESSLNKVVLTAGGGNGPISEPAPPLRLKLLFYFV